MECNVTGVLRYLLEKLLFENLTRIREQPAPVDLREV
jgi:hypothetical protein